MNVYYLPLDVSTWTPIDEQLLSAVSPQRQERIKKYTYAAGRRLSLYAALLSRMGISLLTGIPAKDLAFRPRVWTLIFHTQKTPFSAAFPPKEL